MKKPEWVLLFASILWGTNWIPLKYLTEQGLEGLSLIFLSYLAMFVALTPWILRALKQTALPARALGAIFIFGGLANLCFNYALIHGEVVRVMVLFYLLPVWGVLGGKFILGEHTNLWRYMGVVLAVVGAFVLLGGHKILDKPPTWVDLIALLSGLFFALNNLAFRYTEDTALSVKVGALFAGCVVFSGLSLVFVGVQGGATSAFNGITLLLLALVLAYALAWLLWANLGSQWGVSQMPAGRSSIIIIMELIAAVVTALAIGGEVLSLGMIVGGAMVVSATVIEIWKGPKE